jgi:hypothetical protein
MKPEKAIVPSQGATSFGQFMNEFEMGRALVEVIC